MSDKKMNELASKLIMAYNAEMQQNKEQDMALFNIDYTDVANQPKSAIEDLNTTKHDVNANTNEMGVDNLFALSNQPLTYVITVHIRNIRASKCNNELITQHMSNLELTYGADNVESIVADIFPNFYKQYYGGS